MTRFSRMRVLLAAALPLALPSVALAGNAGARSTPPEDTFYTRMPDDMMVLTHGNLLPAESSIPSDIAQFTEPGVTGGMAMLHKIRDGDGTVIGFGTQLEDTKADAQGHLLLDWPTAWTIVLPGRGMLFLYQIEKPVALLEQQRAVLKEPGPWNGMIEQQTTAGPSPTGRGVIIGGSGEFEGAHGSFVEVNRFTEKTASSPIGVSGEIEIRVSYDKRDVPSSSDKAGDR